MEEPFTVLISAVGQVFVNILPFVGLGFLAMKGSLRKPAIYAYLALSSVIGALPLSMIRTRTLEDLFYGFCGLGIVFFILFLINCVVVRVSKVSDTKRPSRVDILLVTLCSPLSSFLLIYILVAPWGH